MAYTKTIWINDSLPALSADNLNKIENGISDVDGRLTTVEGEVVNFRTATQITNEIAGAVDDLSGVTDAATARTNLSVYEKSTVDTLLSAKADNSTTYSKTEVDNSLALKADSSTTYSKTEVDELVDIDFNDKGTVAVSQICDLTNDSVFIIDMGADLGISFSNIPTGEVVIWYVELTTNGNTITSWPAEVIWDNGNVEPSWSTTGTSIAQFYTRDGGVTIYGKLFFNEV